MAEKKYTEIPVKFSEQEAYVVYSTKGPQKFESFQQAAKDFKDKGEAKGFTFVTRGSGEQKARSWYNQNIAIPIREASKSVGKTAGQAAALMQMITTAPGSIATKSDLSKDLIKKYGKAGGKAGEFLASQVETPEKGAATAALGAGGLITKGTSGLGPLLVRSGLVGGADYATRLMTRTENPFKSAQEATKVAVINGVAQGGFAAIKGVLGLSLGKLANKQVAKDVMTLLKDKYPQLSRAGDNGLKALASTPKGIQELSQIGVKALRRGSKEIGDEFVVSINNIAPHTLGKVPQRKIRQLTESYVQKVDDYMMAAGDDAAQATIGSSVASIRQALKSEVNKAFTKTSDKFKNQVDDMFSAFEYDQMKLMNGADVINALRASGAEAGFNIRRFQEYMRDHYASKSKLFRDVGVAAGRGKPGEVDLPVSAKKFGFQEEWHLPWGIKVPVPSLGHSFAGKVRGGKLGEFTVGATAINKQDEIKDFTKDTNPRDYILELGKAR